MVLTSSLVVSFGLAHGASRRRTLGTCVALPAAPPCTADERKEWNMTSFAWTCTPACGLSSASSQYYFYYEAACRRCASCLRSDPSCGSARNQVSGTPTAGIDCGPHGTAFQQSGLTVNATAALGVRCLCDNGWEQPQCLHCANLDDTAPCTVSTVPQVDTTEAPLGHSTREAVVIALLLCCAACITVPALLACVVCWRRWRRKRATRGEDSGAPPAIRAARTMGGVRAIELEAQGAHAAAPPRSVRAPSGVTFFIADYEILRRDIECIPREHRGPLRLRRRLI